MSKFGHFVRRSQRGFTLIELMLVCAILLIVLAPIFNSISLMAKRSQTEEVKVDISQETREFVDEFERDIHQAGFPNCRMFYNGPTANCLASPQPLWNASIAAGLVYVDNTRIIFEGDVNGDGTVDSIQYKIVDANGANPPANCPCTLQRSQVAKIFADPLAGQGTNWSQELQNIVNSGVPGGQNVYGGGVNITGSTAWGATNTAYYASTTTFKDFPVLTAYDQTGGIITLPVSITTNAANLAKIRSIRLTINVLANQRTGTDLDTKARPIETLVGTGRLVNNTF